MFERIRRAVRAFRQVDPWPDAPAWQREIVARVAPFTMASAEQTLATVAATEYLHRSGIGGDFVECGVWRGGQVMAAMLALQHLGARRVFHLFDTFAGMTAPGAGDVDLTGAAASTIHGKLAARPVGERWCEAGEEEVRANIASTGYPLDQVRFAKGDVLQTVPVAAPASIAFLRLDTDWYESTLHELEHLFPRVSRGGVITIDDYGHWRGARQATDEYISRHGLSAFLHRVDYTGRQWVKQ